MRARTIVTALFATGIAFSAFAADKKLKYPKALRKLGLTWLIKQIPLF